MRWLALWRADVKLIIPKLPIVLLSVAAILLSVVAALPPSLLRGMAARDITIALVCNADPMLTRVISGMATEYELIRRVSIFDEAEDAEAEFEKGLFDVLLVIPGDIEAAIMSGEQVMVSAKAKDPLIGTMLYQLASSTLDAVNGIEHAAGYVYERSRESGLEHAESNRMVFRFVNELFVDAIVRFSYVENVATSRPYDNQALSLILFFTVSLSSIFIAVMSAAQVSDGYLRRISVRGFSVRGFIAVKMINAAILSLLLCSASFAGLYLVNIRCNPISFLVSAALLSVIVSGMCLSVITISLKRGACVSRTLMSCVSLVLILLFWGGGFYPIYLMNFSITSLNPAWLSHLLANWSLTGSFPAAGVFFLFLSPLVVCVPIAGWRLMRSVCC